MIAEVIAIGDELTSGQRLDTNSQWLSQQLEELGAHVLYHSTIGDDLPAMSDAFRLAIERADWIVTTGGLGPTADDLTRQALADALGVRLVTHPKALEHIRTVFRRRSRPMPPQNELQALLPEGAHLVENPHGTAPGIDLAVEREGLPPARLFALPGVPAEMREMWAATVARRLERSQAKKQAVRHRRIKCFGLGESDLEARLPDLVRRGREPRVGITASKATITLRITARGDTPEASFLAMEPTVQTIYECLGDFIFGEEDDELEHVVARLLRRAGKRLAAVEWGSGGLVSEWLADTPQAESVYAGGIVLTSAAAAANFLEAPLAEKTVRHGGSAGLASDLARRGRQMFAADLALAVGPLPTARPKTNAAHDYHLALATPEGVATRSWRLGGHPEIHRPRAAKQGLDLVRLALLEEARSGA